MSITDVATRLNAVLDEIDAVRVSLGKAADLIDEVAATMDAVVAGSAAPDALRASALFGEARESLQSPLAVLQAAEKAIREYLAYLVGRTTTTTPSPGIPLAEADRPYAAPPGTPTSATPERIEQLRRDLPPPVAPGTGRKTHGRWIDTDGNVHAEISGKDEKSEEAIRFFREIKSRRIPTAVTDVEIKLAAHMRRHGIRSSILVINNYPCRGPTGCE